MIERIEVRNFAVARDVTLAPGPGLNVFTGETGAGKSLVVDAIAFALGARRGREVIATGAERAEVRLTFADGTTVERTVGVSGRSSVRISGAAASIDAVQQLATDVDIHGQSEQLGVLRPATQLAILDRYAGCSAITAEFGRMVRELREVRRGLSGLVADSRERERRLEQLRFECEEISSAGLRTGEDDELRAEQARLSSTSRRLADVEEALSALAASSIGDVSRAAADLADRDADATPLLDAATLLEVVASDLARDLRRYRDQVEDDPERLAAVGERLDLLARLKRKYGETVGDVLAYGVAAAAEIERLEGTGYSADELRAREATLVGKLADSAQVLSQARRRGAAELVQAAAEELARLGMAQATLAIGFACEDDAIGLPVDLPDYDIVGRDEQGTVPGSDPVRRAFSETGVDRIEFLASFNIGESARPLGTIASGGEASRFLLALTTVFGASAGAGAIVLDEVDEGVGGRSGALVGESLSRLAAHHQVLCVTHLPQVAAYGMRHFVVTKRSDGGRTWSDVTEITGELRVQELASMLGGDTDANRMAARELLGDAVMPNRE